MDSEKAARKELRILKEQPQDLMIVEEDNQASIVAVHLMKKIFPGWQNKGPIKLHPLSRDELAAKLLTRFFEDRDDDLFKKQYFLTTIDHESLQEYARKHGLEEKGMVFDDREAEASTIIAQMQREQPQTTPSLRKTYEWLREGLNKE